MSQGRPRRAGCLSRAHWDPNTLLSVRRVTEHNAGRLTAGVDGEVVLTPKAKSELVDRVAHSREPFKALPVRRVFIPKPGSKKQRPLGFPDSRSRASGARRERVGARVGSTVRAEVLWIPARPRLPRRDRSDLPDRQGPSPRRLWVLDADLAGAFDRIGHDHLMTMIGTFPARGMIRAWLKAGVVEHGRLSPHRGGNSSGRGDQPPAVERRPARDGGDRRSPILARTITPRWARRCWSGTPTIWCATRRHTTGRR